MRRRRQFYFFRNEPGSFLPERLDIYLELVPERELTGILDLVDLARRTRGVFLEPVLVHPASFARESSCVNSSKVNKYFLFIRLIKSYWSSISAESFPFKMLPRNHLLLVEP